MQLAANRQGQASLQWFHSCLTSIATAARVGFLFMKTGLKSGFLIN